MDDVIRYAEEYASGFLNDVVEFSRVPSISSDSGRGETWLDARSIWRRECAPPDSPEPRSLRRRANRSCTASRLGAPGKPTALVYGHYDVQPVDPLELWDSPPFEPTVRDGMLFGRGVSDDKGQVMMHVAAVESWLRAGGGLPMNVKFLIEGEEEIGSDHFGPFVRTQRDRLAADVLVISDTSLFAKGLPAICYGLRGILYFQIDVEVAGRDLHSGSYGGSVGNPIDVVAHIIAGLKDSQGRVLVPGFYDEVRPLTRQERDEFGRLPYTDAAYLEETGAAALFGEPGYTTFERTWARPTLEPNGVWGGFAGEGTKTSASSQRLREDQLPSRTRPGSRARRPPVQGARAQALPGLGASPHHRVPQREASANADRPSGRAGNRPRPRGRVWRAARLRPCRRIHPRGHDDAGGARRAGSTDGHWPSGRPRARAQRTPGH